MLVVVAIVAIMVGISFPSVSAGLDSVRLASSTQTVASFLNGAVAYVERRQQPVELVISPAENSLAFYSNEPGKNRDLKLPGGVFLEAVLPPAEDESDP